MGVRTSCRSCRHCKPPNGLELGWCKLRQLPIHPDLASELWCHHWMARPSRLSAPNQSGNAATQQTFGNQQLSFIALTQEC